MVKNVHAHLTPGEYDRLRHQYPALWTYARVGGRIAKYLPEWDQPSLDLLTRVTYVSWRTLDSFSAPLLPSLGWDGQIGFLQLIGGWQKLWLNTVATLARPFATRTLTMTQEGTTLLNRLEVDFRVEEVFPPTTWLDMGVTMLLGLGE